MRSSIDGTDQPSFFWRCNDHRDLPLLVGLHTWSTDRYNQVKSFYPLALKNRWHLLLFEFRGPNLNTNPRATEACASKIAMQDVIDAIEKIYYIAKVDKKHIFLIGGSGGAHMALMLAGYRPELWRSVASFCPITDLAPGIVKTRITLRTSKRAAVAHHVLKRLKNTEIVLLFLLTASQNASRFISTTGNLIVQFLLPILSIFSKKYARLIRRRMFFLRFLSVMK
ncbi:MAG: S9 family peptidase [Candidatus Omnitrophica bacterium]|nr:S9 family peptidase [Candidatus Omnitrophota bacterium]